MIKRVALLVVLLLQFHVVTAHTQIAQQTESRKTSTPYTGDLSIFDSPGRDERLQINRVMDMLAIAPSKTVADIGARSGWFTARAARRIGERRHSSVGGHVFSDNSPRRFARKDVSLSNIFKLV